MHSMHSTPLQASRFMREARDMSNAQLAQALSNLQGNRRSYDKDVADAILEEAARRMRWQEAYSTEGLS